MATRQYLRRVVVCFLTILALVAAASRAEAAPRTIEEFVAERDKWPEYAESKLALTLEGRFSSVARNGLRMRNCELPFVPAPGKELAKPAGSSATIEISGTMGFDNGRPAFRVERIRELPSDLDEAQARARRARRTTPDDWYALAQWAAARGAFYKDDELLKESQAAWLRGVAIERAAIPARSADEFFTLAAKVAELKLPETLRQELVHEGYRRRWDRVRQDKQPEFRDLLDQMKRDLPGCEIPLQPPLPRLEQKYAESPLTVYQQSPADERRKLHRVFHAEVTLAMVVRGARPDGSNGMAVGDEIERMLPEQSALAETWRERELQQRLKSIATADRQDMLDLSEQFRKRNRPDVAKQTITTWLARREDLLKKDGPDGLKQLADEHLNLLEDEASAAKYLIAAYKLSPESEEIQERLEKLGYKLKDGQWLTTRQFEALPQDPLYQAMREGRVVPGMTAEQVRKSVGPPTSVARIAALTDVCEVWTYGAKSGTRLSIHLVRRGKTGSESKVTAVLQVAAQ